MFQYNGQDTESHATVLSLSAHGKHNKVDGNQAHPVTGTHGFRARGPSKIDCFEASAGASCQDGLLHGYETPHQTLTAL